MKLSNDEAKQKMIQRLRKIEGQVRGIENMLDDERDCTEIMQQLVAIRSAVQSVSRVFVQEYAAQCLIHMEESETGHTQREKIIQDMITLFDKAP